MTHVVWKLAIHRRPRRYNAVTAIKRSIFWTPKIALLRHLTVITFPYIADQGWWINDLKISRVIKWSWFKFTARERGNSSLNVWAVFQPGISYCVRNPPWNLTLGGIKGRGDVGLTQQSSEKKFRKFLSSKLECFVVLTRCISQWYFFYIFLKSHL